MPIARHRPFALAALDGKIRVLEDESSGPNAPADLASVERKIRWLNVGAL